MTSDLLECVERSYAAERAGDAAEALEWHQAVPMFQRGRHRGVLDRLARLGDELPPWVWARWIVYQVTRCEDSTSATDVQELDLLRFGTPARDYERVMEQLRDGRDEVGRAGYRILQRALGGSIAQRDAAYVGAAALNPHADTEVRSRLLRDGQYDAWSRWAALVPEPARSRLLEFAEVSRAVA
jgi:hypothetical protein